ncbi:MAG: hypothetical protein WCO68_04190 [Verrucomicrobiota bacterium]
MDLESAFCKCLWIRFIGKSPTLLTESNRVAEIPKFPFSWHRAICIAPTETNQKKHIMKKLTLTALAAVAVAGTSFAGPCAVMSKDFKQPCTTPCFRDQEFQLDLFYSYNDAQGRGERSGSRSFTSDPALTPVGGTRASSLGILNNPALIPTGSTVVTDGEASAKASPYFRDGSGGGVGMNYFFARYFGIGVEGNWWEGTQQSVRGSASIADQVTLNGVNAGTAAAVVANLQANGINAAQVDASTLRLGNSARFSRTDKKVANQVTGSLILRYPFEGPVCWAPYIFGGGGGVFDSESTGFGHLGLGVEFRVTPYMGFFTDWRWEFMGKNNNNNDSRIRDIAKAAGLSTVDFDNNNKRQDVNMTRVGVRFVF